MKYLFLSISFLMFLLLYGCSNNTSKLESALELSGQNRIELEKVLHHFSQNSADSLKLRAAEFLISNMPEHYSLYNENIEKYIQENYPNLPYFLINTLFCEILPNIPDMEFGNSVNVKDIDVITADFLINHINKSLQIWNGVPWSKNLSFQTFCEYVLPYRIGFEPLEYIMKDSATILTSSMLRMLNDCGIPLRDFRENFSYQLREVKLNYPYRLPSILGPYSEYSSFLTKWKDCMYHSYRELSVYRKKGIPAFVDRTLFWSGRNGGHYWPISMDPYTYQELIEDPFVTTAKVYRRTYSHNEIPIFDGTNHIPSSFADPFLKDVTDLYFRVADLNVELNGNPKYAYLSVFNTLRWQPVAWGKVKNKKATFKKMGGGAVYLPLYYNKNEEISGGYPFSVDAFGNMQQLKPNTSSLISLHLLRKSNLTFEKTKWSEMLVKLTIEGANRLDFKQSRMLYSIDSIDYGPFYKHKMDSVHDYRYYRITQPDKSDFTLAELFLYDKDGSRLVPKGLTINGKYLSLNEKECEGSDCREIGKMFDSDYLSYYTIRRSGVENNSIVFDFGKPVKIAEVRFMPRNDENYIYPGDTYELFYRDESKWVSLGKREAVDYFLEYNNVPRGALYWLRNHTKGREERVFTYENGQIRFW